MSEEDKKAVIKGQQQRVVRTKANLNEAVLNTMNLGRVYWDKTVNHLQEFADKNLIVKYLNKINEMPKTGTGLWISGNVGVGKSTAAAIIAKEAASWAHSVYVVSIQALREEKKNFGDDDSSFKQKMQKMMDVTFLIVEDLQEEFVADKWLGPQQLAVLLKERARLFKPTIVTSSIRKWQEREEMALLYEVVKENMITVKIAGEKVINLRDGLEKARREALLGDK